jgi:hypothetical protein
MPSGVRPTFMAVGPDGTAYVQGDNPRKRELVPEVFVYSPTGKLLRRFAIPKETEVGAFGNGQLYIYTPMAGRVFGLNPLNGAQVSDVGGGLQMEGYPAKLGFPVALAVGPGGTIYESGGETSIPEPGNPNSTIPINPIETFDRTGAYVGYVEPQFPTIGAVTVTSVNASGDMLGIWATLQGTGIEGVVSAQGAALDQFVNFPPRPEVVGAAFAPDGQSIYAGVVVLHGSGGTDFVAKLTFGGKVLEKFGIVPIHDFANTCHMIRSGSPPTATAGRSATAQTACIASTPRHGASQENAEIARSIIGPVDRQASGVAAPTITAAAWPPATRQAIST